MDLLDYKQDTDDILKLLMRKTKQFGFCNKAISAFPLDAKKHFNWIKVN